LSDPCVQGKKLFILRQKGISFRLRTPASHFVVTTKKHAKQQQQMTIKTSCIKAIAPNGKYEKIKFVY